MAEQVLASLQAQNQYRGAYHIHIPVERLPLPPSDQGFNVPSPSSLSPTGETLEWEGLSIISRFYIKESGCCWLTPPFQISGDLNTRATQLACIDLSDGRYPPNYVYIFNTHFAYDVGDAVDDVNQTIQYIQKITPSNAAYLLAGDFNMEPGSEPVEILDKNPNFVDLWYRLWGTQSKGLTYPSSAPIKRIDFMFTSPTLTQLAKAIFLCGSAPDNLGNYPSDHLGLIATFAVPSSGTTNINTTTIQKTASEDELLNGFVIV
eukprot:TRINITY_DN13378_c0_g1_i1.p1 TRINITY_DN13378_c0_g1~~TRINITY_DN13378_c0_g1_i1.p1  ORF type:complete len:300 (+),score=56.53 TRINITY_DN13378_c0_g1_i1:115-900(+)